MYLPSSKPNVAARSVLNGKLFEHGDYARVAPPQTLRDELHAEHGRRWKDAASSQTRAPYEFCCRYLHAP